MRHHGYVPWDDDIDVSMPREDYEKLQRLFNNDDNLFGEYKLAAYNNKYNVYKPFLNLIDPRTITISRFRQEKYYYPLFIDIFPEDFTSSVKNAEKIYHKIDILKRRVKRSLFTFDLVPLSTRKGLKNKVKGFGSNMINLYKHIFIERPRLAVPRLKKIDKIAQSSKSDDILINFMSSGGVKKNITKMSYYDDYMLFDFEGHKFRGPKEYDQRLSYYFGDYMTPPPENQRQPHSLEVYFINK